MKARNPKRRQMCAFRKDHAAVELSGPVKVSQSGKGRPCMAPPL